MHDVTLQFNLSQGDISFVSQTIPPLVEAHRRNIDEVIAIVDCCQPPWRRTADPDSDFLESEYKQRTKEICTIAEDLKKKGYLDKIIYLYKNDPMLSVLYRKYLNNIIRQTHESNGKPFVVYLLALEACNTRYLIHYDADIFLYQAPDYDWAIEARCFMEKEPMIIDASPRISPPFAENKHLPDAPSLNWKMPAISIEGGWHSEWFSARCFLIDREKLFYYLPLVKGSQIELLVRKFLHRTYPWAFEILLSKRLRIVKGTRLVLNSEQAWILHPSKRTPRYLELLPRIQKAILQGRLPLEQRGQEDIDVLAWEDFLANT
jgi:hypothetical protein